MTRRGGRREWFCKDVEATSSCDAMQRDVVQRATHGLAGPNAQCCEEQVQSRWTEKCVPDLDWTICAQLSVVFAGKARYVVLVVVVVDWG